ncbi:uncharacterized protein M6B38_170265 [Iris pallida]|uniref:Uncharacterized protein n=1 Tax=Iris pallida TaxID=29817 RepID=A0AAX6ETH1_IRIPA|nr:uncharacterized protein M6B38_170265 [Iris pallida]
MTRRCSHCSNNGHNSRTCPSRGVKLFGVRLDESIRKSASMGNLVHYSGPSSNAGGSSPDGIDGGGSAAADKEMDRDREGGYASEEDSKGRERKKGVAWTEEEHKKFLLGLRKLGKGDWRGIARNYVGSRTPTQVASHAQKFFIRQSNTSRRKKRSSLFDIVPDEFRDAQAFPMGIEEPEAQGSIQLPGPPPVDAECESMVSSSNERKVGPHLPKPENMQYPFPVMLPAFYPAYYPIPLPFLPGYSVETMENKAHEVFKPTALHSKVPISSDQLVGMSTLSLRDSVGEHSSSSATLNLLGGSERHSAFHANTQPTAGSKMDSGSSPIHAI